MEKNKKIGTGDKVSLYYCGKLENGTIFDAHYEKSPFTYTVGSGLVLPSFEAHLLGMEESQRKNFTIPPEEAYGRYQDKLLIEVPLERLPHGVKPHIGLLLKIPLKKLKQHYPVKIIGISPVSVTVDANHALAGKHLFFQVEIVRIIPPNKEDTND